MSKKVSKNPNYQDKKIVCIGGGNAMPKAVLVGLKKYPVKLSVICAMLDSGGSAGRLRNDYNIVSPGDIRRAFLALSCASPEIQDLFNYRFESGELKGHNFANILITALELSSNNYEQAFDTVKNLLNVKHTVLPVTLDNSNLYAILENGQKILGETNIDIPQHDGSLKIKDVYLEPKPKAYPKAVEAIGDSEMIVMGPGDLYSSLSQILLTEGVSEAILNSKAKKVYVCNLMTKYGETNNFTVSDFTDTIERYLDGEVDYVIYNNKKPSVKRLSLYRKEHPELLGLVKFSKSLNKKKFIGVDILKDNGPISHDPDKVAKNILKLCSV